MDDITYKYFIAEGERVNAIMADADAKSAVAGAKIHDLLTKHNADVLFRCRGCAPNGIAFKLKNYPSVKPAMRENFLKPEISMKGDTRYAVYRPDKRRKAGREILKELKSVGDFSYDLYYCRETGAFRRVFGMQGGRCVMCETHGGRYGDKLVFRVPVCADMSEKFAPPEYFREIKKSKFIAITEEEEKA